MSSATFEHGSILYLAAAKIGITAKNGLPLLPVFVSQSLPYGLNASNFRRAGLGG
jgi:hypothetical protein